MPTKKNNLELELTEMYQASIPFLQEYPWEMEDDRWAELIVSLFSGIGTDPAIATHAVKLLGRLNLLTAKDLAEENDVQAAFVLQALLQAGMEKQQAEQSTAALLKLSGLINKKWKGHIQRLLRVHAVKMVQELQGYLIQSGIERKQSKRIATVWLQNVCNLPVLLDGDPHIAIFCSKFNVTETALVDTLDELGLNVCVADDLMAIFHEPNGSVAKLKKGKPERKTQKKQAAAN